MRTNWIFMLLLLVILPIEAKKLKFPNGDVYEGEVKHKKPDGRGTMFYADGREYTGMWINGLKNGEGKLTFMNGDSYEGQFAYDNFQNGIAIKGLSKYIGLFFNDAIVKGSESTDHSFMDGEWKNGKLYNGTYCLYIDDNYYNGVMKDGKFYGDCYMVEIPETRIKNFVGVIDNYLPVSGKGVIITNYNDIKKTDVKDQKRKYVPEDERTSEFKNYDSYCAFPDKLPKGLSHADWENYVYDVTGGKFPHYTSLKINPSAEKLRQNRIEAIKREKEEEEERIRQRRLSGIDYIETKEQFDNKIAKPAFKDPNSKWGTVEFNNSQMTLKKEDIIFDVSLQEIARYSNFSDFFEANYQKVLTLNNEELNKYKNFLNGYVFTTTVPFSQYEPMVGGLLDLYALMTSEVVIFSIEKGTVVYGLLTALDRDRIPRNVTRGKLLQQQLIANEYNRGTKTYDFQLSDEIFSFIEIYKVDGKEVNATRHFKYDKQKDMLYDVDHELYLEKKPISDYQ